MQMAVAASNPMARVVPRTHPKPISLALDSMVLSLLNGRPLAVEVLEISQNRLNSMTPETDPGVAEESWPAMADSFSGESSNVCSSITNISARDDQSVNSRRKFGSDFPHSYWQTGNTGLKFSITARVCRS